jgi:uncharacterized protein (TIGR02996 family)
MTDKQSLLNAIKTSPTEDLPRLLYADWLQEHDESPVAKATVEFIRISCDMKEQGRRNGTVGPYMPRAAYQWIEDNWQRLIPSAVALHNPVAGSRPVFERTGRIIRASWRVRYDDNCPWRLFTAVLEFNRGFLERAWIWSQFLTKTLTGPLKNDQPLVTFPFGSPPTGGEAALGAA